MAKESKSQFLTNDELNFIKEGTTEFTKIKIAIGEIELRKQSLLKDAEAIIGAFTQNEKMLIEKYGENAVINTNTGEVTQKES
jgi:hypothetical protein